MQPVSNVLNSLQLVQKVEAGTCSAVLWSQPRDDVELLDISLNWLGSTPDYGKSRQQQGVPTIQPALLTSTVNHHFSSPIFKFHLTYVKILGSNPVVRKNYSTIWGVICLVTCNWPEFDWTMMHKNLCSQFLFCFRYNILSQDYSIRTPLNISWADLSTCDVTFPNLLRSYLELQWHLPRAPSCWWGEPRNKPNLIDA